MKQARMAHSLFKTLERYSILMMTPSISNFFHTRCVSHILNLPASTDADKAYCDIVHKKQYHAAFSKCITLWDTVNKSSKAVDAVKEVYDKQLIRKMVTGATRSMKVSNVRWIVTKLESLLTYVMLCKNQG